MQVWCCGFRGIGAMVIAVGMTTVLAQLSATASLPLKTAMVGDFASTYFGDYQIAPFAARSTAKGWWALWATI